LDRYLNLVFLISLFEDRNIAHISYKSSQCYRHVNRDDKHLGTEVHVHSFRFPFFASTNDRRLINQLAYELSKKHQLAYDACIVASYTIEWRLWTVYSTHVYIEYAILGKSTWTPYTSCPAWRTTLTVSLVLLCIY
jgi:hypothetical protein